METLLGHGKDVNMIGAILCQDRVVYVSITWLWMSPRGLVDTTDHNCCKDLFDNLHLKTNTPTAPLHEARREYPCILNSALNCTDRQSQDWDQCGCFWGGTRFPWCTSGVGLQLNWGDIHTAGRGAAYMRASLKPAGWDGVYPRLLSCSVRQVYFEAFRPPWLSDVGRSSVSSDWQVDVPCLLAGMSLGLRAKAAWHWLDVCRLWLREAAELVGCPGTQITGWDNRSGLGRSRQSCSGVLCPWERLLGQVWGSLEELWWEE